MYISINTDQALSELDMRVLNALIGDGVGAPATPAPEAAKPAQKAVESKPAAKAKPAAKKPEPEPEEKPEPMAEEPLPEEPEEVEEDQDDEMSDEDLIALAVKKATEMVSGGDAAKVREALDAAGANRVRELNKDNVREFFKALS